jgi:hypothetical protein
VFRGGGGGVYTRFLKQNFIFKEGSIKVNCSYKVITERERERVGFKVMLDVIWY